MVKRFGVLLGWLNTGRSFNMKILFITSKFPRWKGDSQPAFTYYLAKELIRLGHDIYVIAPHYPKSKFFEKFEGICVYRFRYFMPYSLEKLAYGAGIPANLKNSFLAKLQVPFFTLSEIIFVKKIIKKINPDIIHAHWAFPQGLAAKMTGLNYIITIYGGEIFLANKYKLITVLDNIIKNSYKSFALTSGLRDVMKEFGIKSEIDIIPLGVDTNVFKNNIHSKNIKKIYCPNNELMILSVGRLVEKKGMEYLISAFKKVKDEITNVKLVIVGNGHLYNKLLNLRDKLGLQKDVIFTKEINHGLLPKYYSASDLFVLPSIIDNIGDRETQGVVFLEAMVSGIPVIGTNTGGIPDIISNKNVGVLVPEKNSEKLAREIIKLLKNKKLREKYSKNGYDHAFRNFNWKSIAVRYANVYKEMLN